jgi:hypothetical protein
MPVDTLMTVTGVFPTFSISLDASSLGMYSANQVAEFGLPGPAGWAGPTRKAQLIAPTSFTAPEQLQPRSKCSINIRSLGEIVQVNGIGKAGRG